MSLFDRDNKNGGTYVECRRCGATVETAETACPHCESDEIAVYEF